MNNVRDRQNPNRVVVREAAAATGPSRLSRRSTARTGLFGKKDPEETEAVKAMKSFESQQIPDPFNSKYTTSFTASGPQNILPPPYNPYTLIRFPNENNTLRQCIDAMVINIESMGYRLEYIGPENGEEGAEAQGEKIRLESLLSQPNGEYGLIDFRERLRRDYETFGYSFFEVCRSEYGRDIVSYYHVPAHTIRLTTQDAEETQVDIWLPRGGKFVKQKVMRRFRRYVQEIGTKRIYFKEFGDPRVISAETGLVVASLDVSEQASEIKIMNLYTPGSAYGMPRWINQLPAIMGSRESELTNLNFFKSNAIPAMAILVSGGTLTADSIDEIEEHVTSVKGRDSVHRVMILEAEGSEHAAAPDKSIPSPKLEIKPLVNDRQKDALFQEYDANNMKKVRSSFRLSPMLLGGSEDVTYATAQASLVVAEGQVFGPERNKMDDLFNYTILSDENGRPPVNWAFRSNPPRIADPKMVIEALDTLETLGALTPNISIGIANELFDLKIKRITEVWGDYPFAMAVALLEKGELKGMEKLRQAVVEPPQDEEDNVADDPIEDPTQKIKDAVMQPLKKLVNTGNVRKSRSKK